MLSDVIELFRSIYEACGELYEYASLIGERQTNAIQNEIFKQYELELKLIHARAELSEQNELHRLAYRNAELIPRKRFLFFRNKAAKLNDGEVGTVVENYFEERLSALTALTKAVKRLKELSEVSEDPLEKLWDLLAKAVANAEPADVPADVPAEPVDVPAEPAPEPAPNTVQKPADVPPAVVTGQTAESAANESPKPVEKPAEPAQKPDDVAAPAVHRGHAAGERSQNHGSKPRKPQKE